MNRIDKKYSGPAICRATICRGVGIYRGGVWLPKILLKTNSPHYRSQFVDQQIAGIIDIGPYEVVIKRNKISVPFSIPIAGF